MNAQFAAVTKAKFDASRIAQKAARFEAIKGRDADGKYRARFYDAAGNVVAYTEAAVMAKPELVTYYLSAAL